MIVKTASIKKDQRQMPEAHWRSLGKQLSLNDLQTENWKSFRFGMRLHHEGLEQQAEAWLRRAERSLFTNLYEMRKPLGARAVDRLAKRFYQEGVAGWLNAFDSLRRRDSMQSVVLQAKEGQRLLVLSQSLVRETGARCNPLPGFTKLSA